MNNTQTFLQGIATVAQSVIKSLKDGKVDFTDLGYFFDDLAPVQNAIEAASFMPGELKALKIDDIDGIVNSSLAVIENELDDDAFYKAEALLKAVLVIIAIANK